jgi:putative transposase
MGQSLVKQYTHIIFSTKHQQPLIIDSIEEELYKYIGGICKNLDCNPVIIGGYKNHVHILCLLSKKIALMKLLETVKTNSSKWVKTLDNRLSNFYWQNGYGAFSIDPRQTDKTEIYIKNQREHHRVKTFQEEYLAILKEYNMEYDERYLWD